MTNLKIKKIGTHPLVSGNIYSFENSKIKILHTVENGKNHISLSYPDKLPTYEEMKEARYQICPDIKNMAQIFPPKEEFVNLHPYCLHLWEI